MPRPTKLTPELHRRIVGMILAGVFPEIAAGACGVSRATFYEWLQRGAGEHPKRSASPSLVAFANDVKSATDAAEVRLVTKVAEYIEGTRPSKRTPGTRVQSRITMGQVIATQWLLARRFAARWAQRPTLLVQSDAAPVVATPEAARAAVARHFAGGVGPDGGRGDEG